ncbi:MAG: coiled-coil domain-containing protein [Bacteroidales bacterium]
MADQINPNSKSKASLLMLITIILLLISNIFFIYKFYTVRKEKVYVQVELKDTENEKALIEEQLKDMLNQYNTLKTDNSKILAELEQEKNKIKELLNEIKNIKSANAYQINQYKKELETLRQIMRSYIVQIDSLNTRNKLLTEENRKVKTDFQKVLTEKENLSQKNQELEQKVEIASTLRAINITSVAVNDRAKEVNRAKRASKIRVCFTLTENAIVKPGNRFVYIRIAKPNKEILPNPDNDMFDYLGDKILYSAKREIDYQNKDVDMCIYWTNDGSLVAGVYNVDIFCDGKQIGSDTFMLK